MIILNYFPNLKKKYTAMAQSSGDDDGNRIDLLQYNVQERIEYYTQE